MDCGKMRNVWWYRMASTTAQGPPCFIIEKSLSKLIGNNKLGWEKLDFFVKFSGNAYYYAFLFTGHFYIYSISPTAFNWPISRHVMLIFSFLFFYFFSQKKRKRVSNVCLVFPVEHIFCLVSRIFFHEIKITDCELFAHMRNSVICDEHFLYMSKARLFSTKPTTLLLRNAIRFECENNHIYIFWHQEIFAALYTTAMKRIFVCILLLLLFFW